MARHGGSCASNARGGQNLGAHPCLLLSQRSKEMLFGPCTADFRTIRAAARHAGAWPHIALARWAEGACGSACVALHHKDTVHAQLSRALSLRARTTSMRCRWRAAHARCWDRGPTSWRFASTKRKRAVVLFCAFHNRARSSCVEWLHGSIA